MKMGLFKVLKKFFRQYQLYKVNLTYYHHSGIKTSNKDVFLPFCHYRWIFDERK